MVMYEIITQIALESTHTVQTFTKDILVSFLGVCRNLSKESFLKLVEPRPTPPKKFIKICLCL